MNGAQKSAVSIFQIWLFALWAFAGLVVLDLPPVETLLFYWVGVHTVIGITLTAARTVYALQSDQEAAEDKEADDG